MTYEEANKTENIIKALNKRRMCPCGYCTSDKCVPEPVMLECKEKDFVINKAIDALEKQIPKKPLPDDEGYEGICPACGVHFIDRLTKFCGNCGQALDWTE